MIVLADNYKDQNIDINVAAICVRENLELVKKFDVYTLPTLMLYYHGMGLKYHDYGVDFKIIHQFSEGKINFNEIHKIKTKSLKVFDKLMDYSKHAIIYYGHEIGKLEQKI